MTPPADRPAPRRFAYVDWLRGLAVLLMIEIHTYDAWVAPWHRGRPFFRWARLLGGGAAPLFLYLAGFSLAIGLCGGLRRGEPVAALRRRTLRRALEVLGYALGFRALSLVFGGHDLTLLFRVDVLNCIAASLALVALTCYAPSAPASARRAVLAVLVVALATPLAARLRWPSAPPLALLTSYLYGARPLALFPLLPWCAFPFAGLAAGVALVGAAGEPERELRALGRLFVAGLALYLGGKLAHATLWAHQPSDWRWTVSPGYTAIRCGVMLLLTVAGVLVAAALPARAPDPLQALGRASMAIYVVHIQIVYGWPSFALKRRLGLAAATAGVLAVTLAMLALAWARGRGWPRLRTRRRARAAASAGGTSG